MAKTFAPTMKWPPKGGEPVVYDHLEDIPKDWLDSPAVAGEAVKELDRDEIVKALNDGGVKFAEKAKTKDLLDLLTTSVKKALDGSNIAYDASLTTRELLALLTA